jgi:hypothetical protein
VLSHIRKLVGEQVAPGDSDGALLERFIARGDQEAFAALLVMVQWYWASAGGCSGTPRLMCALVCLAPVARCAAKGSPTPNLEALWDDLAATDATRAFRAVRLLQAFPQEAAALIQSRVKPAVAVAPANIDRWIDDLSSPQFGVRQNATEQLAKAGPQAGPALRRALLSKPSLDVRQRLEALLGKDGTLSGDQLRAWRATEVLEGIGTTAAQQLLQKLGQGAPGDPITEEAKSCLKRLTR